jgi:hypothetical protein
MNLLLVSQVYDITYLLTSQSVGVWKSSPVMFGTRSVVNDTTISYYNAELYGYFKAFLQLF